MKFDLILAVDDGDGQVTNISLGQVARPEVSDMGRGSKRRYTLNEGRSVRR
jgi:hypothetical protein